MALCNSGAMSLGGDTIGRSVNCELGLSGTAEISMDDAAVRGLAGVPSGEIAMDDFYGASSGPSAFGEEFGGGYYLGTIAAAGSNYYIIVSPSSGNASCCYGAATSDGVGCERCDGYGNTYDHLNSAPHPAGFFAGSSTINGCTDWYLPAVCELRCAYCNCNCAPAGHGLCNAETWSSTESGDFTCDARTWQVTFQSISRKSITRCVRIARREAY